MSERSTNPSVSSGVAHTLRGAGRDAATGALGVGAVIAVWAIVAIALDDATRLPSPLGVFEVVGSAWTSIPALTYITFQEGGIADALAYTAVRVLVTVTIGCLVGLVVGIAMARSRLIDGLLNVPLTVFGTVPLLVILPFVTLWFGTAGWAQSALVLAFAVITATFTARGAAVAVSGHYTDYARCLGASRARVLWSVVLPASMPEFFGAIRLSLAIGWGWQCLAELQGGNNGMGRIFKFTAQLNDTATLLAAILCLVCTAVIVDAVAALIGRYITRWTE